MNQVDELIEQFNSIFTTRYGTKVEKKENSRTFHELSSTIPRAIPVSTASSITQSILQADPGFLQNDCIASIKSGTNSLDREDLEHV